MSKSPAFEPPDPLPVAVIGCGRMGRFHARTYSQLAGAKLVGVLDADPQKATAAAAEYGTKVFADLDALLAETRAVTIAVPTEHHLAAATPLLTAGIACLIEKPLAGSVDQARRIVELASAGSAVVQVGHIERFNPAVRAVVALGLSPRFMEVTRISPMTFRSIDVGVVLDMMIHDIDVVLKLAGSTVERVEACGVNVVGHAEDICSARLTFANGCVANLTGSRLATKTERRLRLYAADAFVSMDYQQRRGVIFRREANQPALHEAFEKLKRGDVKDPTQLNYESLLKMEPLATDEQDPLRAQLESFLGAVRGEHPPVVSAADGLAAVEVATRIVRAIGK